MVFGFLSELGSGITGTILTMGNAGHKVFNTGIGVVTSMGNEGHEIFEGGLTLAGDVGRRVEAGAEAGIKALPGAIDQALDEATKIVGKVVNAPSNAIFGTGPEGTINRYATLAALGGGGFLLYKLLK